MSDHQARLAIAFYIFASFFVFFPIAAQYGFGPYQNNHAGSLWLWSFTFLSFLNLITLYFRWRKMGDPRNILSEARPQFNQPDNLSPTASLYLLGMGNIDEEKLIITPLLSLASKGVLALSKSRITRLSGNRAKLSPDENLLLDVLSLETLGNYCEIEHEKREESRSHLQKIKSQLIDQLEEDLDEYITRNVSTIRKDLLLLTLLLICFSVGYPLGVLLFALLPPIFIYIWRSTRSRKIFAASLISFVFVFLNWDNSISDIFSFAMPFFAIGLITITSLMIITELRNFSITGAEKVDHLNGMKRYLNEQTHGTFQNEPKPTIHLYLHLFPYAYAMGTLETWANKFSSERKKWLELEEIDKEIYQALVDYEKNPDLPSDLVKIIIHGKPSN